MSQFAPSSDINRNVHKKQEKNNNNDLKKHVKAWYESLSPFEFDALRELSERRGWVDVKVTSPCKLLLS